MTPHRRLGVLARFEHLDQARRALKSLENRGIDGADLAFVGARSSRARHVHSVSGPDRRVAHHILGLLVRGVLLGALGGAAASAVVIGLTSLFMEGVRERPLAQVMVLVAFAFLGAVVGAFATVERGVGLSESWHLAFQDIPDGDIWLLVLARDPALAGLLTELGASEVLEPTTDHVPSTRTSRRPHEGPALDGVARDAETLAETINDLERQGFRGSFQVRRPGFICCLQCHQEWESELARVATLRRLEGASDPADMLAVAAITCPKCGADGTLVVNYGPEATPEDDATLNALGTVATT